MNKKYQITVFMQFAAQSWRHILNKQFHEYIFTNIIWDSKAAQNAVSRVSCLDTGPQQSHESSCPERTQTWFNVLLLKS